MQTDLHRTGNPTPADRQGIRVTRTCRACRRPMVLWMDNSGSGWQHQAAADELTCWRQNRALYEDGTL